MIKQLWKTGWLLTVSLMLTGAAYAQTWDFGDGDPGNWFGDAAELEVTDERYETGGYSVRFTATDDDNEAWFRNETDTETLVEGTVIRYRVWVSEDDLDDINGLQAFLQDGEGWGWNATWHDSGDLAAGEWNDLEFVLDFEPDDGIVQVFGLQINQHNAEDTPTVYVDRVSIEELPGNGVEELLTEWDFEDGDPGNWFGDAAELEATDERYETGGYSVRFTATDDDNEAWFRNETDTDMLEENTIIRYRVWVSEGDLEEINGLQAFLQDGEGWGWNATWHDSADLAAGEWNDLEFVLDFEPDDGIVQVFGLQINQYNAEDTPSVYVDRVSVYSFEEVEEEPEFELETIYARTFEDEQMGDWAIADDAEYDAAGSAELTDDRYEEGGYSVRMTASDSDPNMQLRNEEIADEVEVLDLISFRVWISADDLELIESIGPAMEHGILHQGWSYEAYTADDLEADAWNTLTLEVDEILNAMGHFVALHVEGNDAQDTPVVYVDKVTIERPVFPDPADIVSRPDAGNLLFGFEEDDAGDLQGWTADENTGASNLEVTDEWSSYGSYALVADFEMDGESEAILEVEDADGMDLSAYSHLSAIVRHSDEGDADGMVAKLFVKTGGDWTWHDHEAKEIGHNDDESGYILLFELDEIAGLADVKAIGVQFWSGDNASGTTRIYVDEVRSHPLDVEEIDLPEGTDLLYSFEMDGEGDLQGWDSSGDNVSFVEVTDEWSSEGDFSQFTDIELGSAGTYHFRKTYGAEDPADWFDQYSYLTAVVRHDGEAPNYGDGGLLAHIYIMTDGWNWQDHPAINVTSAEEGTLLTFDLSDVVDLGVVFAMGVQFIENPNAAGETRLYLDEVRGHYDVTTDAEEESPARFALDQNYPNPFNPVTNISFELPMQTQVTLDVYNVLGQRVMTLVDQELTQGTHRVTFDGTRLASGVYIYRLEAGDFVKTRKMMLVK